MEVTSEERLIWRGHPSARSSLGSLLKWGFVAALPVIIAGLAKLNDRGTGLAFWKWVTLSVLLLLLVLFVDVVRRALVDYVVTDHRIRIRRGVLSRTEQSASIDRIQNINTTQGPLDRILRIGAIDFDTAGTEVAQASFRFSGVARPNELVRRLESHLATLRKPLAN